MNDAARRELQKIIATYPDRLPDDPRWCRALLRDLLAAYPRELSVLLAAVDEGVPAQLWNPYRSAGDYVPPDVAVPRFVEALVRRHGLTEAEARWAVESWAVAIGGTDYRPVAVSHPSRIACPTCGAPQSPFAAACTECGHRIALIGGPESEPLLARGTVYSHVPRLRATLSAAWEVRESLTIRLADGAANVIVSTEPVLRSLDSHGYATAQGDVLVDEFPDYHELSFAPASVFGNRAGYVRHFSWTPSNGEPVRQIQHYHAQGGLGTTATATAAATAFASLEAELGAALAGLRLASDG